LEHIEEHRGNLFETDSQTIVNTVNCVGVMGRGIALEYKYRYPEMYADYKRKCSNQFFKPGKLDIWREPEPDGRWILNFPTKVDWKHPSKIEYLKLGLEKFAEIYKDEGITSIAFPPLGATSGGLDWEYEVSPVMYEYLAPLENLDIEIVLFNPEAADSYFDKLLAQVTEYSVADFKVHLGLPQKQATILHGEISGGNIQTMLGLQQVRGLGAQTIERVYSYLRNDYSAPTFAGMKGLEDSTDDGVSKH
jgi:O-acetyl-ADP-ribose deacetylase (regulator of RNase III)